METWSDPANPNTCWRLYNPTLDREYFGSYGLNYWVNTRGTNITEDPEKYFGTDLLRRASGNVPLFADCVWIGSLPDDQDNPRMQEGSWYASYMDRFSIMRHRGAIQVVFLDGSSDKVPLAELWKFKWNRKFDIHNPKTDGNYNWPAWMTP